MSFQNSSAHQRGSCGVDVTLQMVNPSTGRAYPGFFHVDATGNIVMDERRAA